MYKHILIGTEGSQLGDKAVMHGLALAKTVGANVTVVTVTETWSPVDVALEASRDRHNPNPLLQFEAMAAGAAKRHPRCRCGQSKSRRCRLSGSACA